MKTKNALSNISEHCFQMRLDISGTVMLKEAIDSNDASHVRPNLAAIIPDKEKLLVT
jgi:hypothetical protein